MDSDLREHLRKRALEFGFHDLPLDRFDRYLATLIRWNQRINLTAVREPLAIVERHFADSLAAASLIGPNGKTIVDVGSGGGFPGAVIAIAYPSVQVTCVESIHKKVAFLQQLQREVASNLLPLAERCETLVRQGKTFGVAISRATFSPEEWLTRGAPLVQPAGQLLAMQAGEDHLNAPVGFSRGRVLTYSCDGRIHSVCEFIRS